ncbi:hypothetical protein ACHWQZ_G011760 [Mnemiopsis leidyi]
MAEDDCFEGLYHFLKVLGEGSFGKAVLYRRYSDNFLVVWKEVKLKSDKEVQAAQHEVDVLSLLSHRNIVGYYNNYVDSEVMYIEMEYANGGTLSHLIGLQQQPFPEEEVLWYFYQLCCACAYLHSNGIIHRDIKTVNIFLNKTGILKVGDFGISKMLTSDSEAADSIVGTPYYMSPEICRGLPYGYKSDVWSCGCVLYEMLELRKTFDATNQLRLVYSIVTKEFKPVSESWSQDLRNILTSMLQKDPDNRPTVQDILDTPYMKGCEKILEERLGPQNYVRGLSQLSPGRQPVLTNLSSEVYIWGGGKTSPQTLATFKKDLGAVRVCVAPKHFCVVTVEKELYVWSSGQPGEMYGQLGHGDKASYRSPKRVEHLVGSGVVDVVAGEDFTLAVVEDEYDEQHQLVAFGSNYDGCLGLGEEVDNYLVPTPVPFFNGVAISSVSCGDAHVMATTLDGDLYGWGNGEYGCLGNDCEDILYIPQKLEIRGTKFAKVACGRHCSFVITTGGKLMACGDNQDNKLGINKIGRKGAKVAKCGETFTLKPVYGLSSVAVREVACGVDHTAVIDAYDRIWTLGSNKCGQRGIGHYKVYSQPTIVKAKLAGKKIALVSAGDRFTVATTVDNEVYSWGYRNHGRLGDGTNNELGNSSRNSVCTPTPIFSSLHYIPALSSRGWYTLLVAEQVISAQLIGAAETQVSRQDSLDSAKTPTWLHNEMEMCDKPPPTPNFGGGKMFRNEMSLRSYDHQSSSGVSSANSQELVTSDSGHSSGSHHLHSSKSVSAASCSSSGVASADSHPQSVSERAPVPTHTSSADPPEVTSGKLQPPGTSSKTPPTSPPPEYRAEFSFSEVRLREALAKSTRIDVNSLEPIPGSSGDSGGESLPTPTPVLAAERVTPEERIRQLEEELEKERGKVRERDRTIAELEQKLMKYQLDELKGVMD